jgi:zinc protease
MSSIELFHTKLSNGIRIIANPNDSGSAVALTGSIKAGTMFDPQFGYGTAELVSRLLVRGTKKHSGDEISQRIEEMGATLQFSNYDETVSFSGRCHVDHLSRLLEIASDCIVEPSFSDEEVRKTKSEILSDLEAERDETRTMAYKGLMELEYGKDKPYGKNTLGVFEDVERLNSEDTRKFHEEYYNPDAMILAATGRFDFDVLVSQVESAFANWNKRSLGSAKANGQLEIPKPSSRTVKMEHKSQVDIALGARAVPRKSKEFYPLNLGNLMLGRIGLYGRLGKYVRDEKGLAYYCYSILSARILAGHIAVLAGVNPKNLDMALEEILKQIGRISSEPLSKDEMEKGKKNLRGSMSMALESSVERVNLIHEIEYHSLGLDYLERYPSLIDSVTAEDSLESFAKYFKPKDVSIVVAGPVSKEINVPIERTQSG